jgi:CDGSH-type Zn-finger protein
MPDDRPIPMRRPIVVDEPAGEKWWCACGRSTQQPFCDGSHAGTDHEPLCTVIEEARRVAWCTCKRTSTPPFCDGTHARLPPA